MGFFEWIISFFKSEEPKAVEPVKAKAKAPAAQPEAVKVTKASLSKLTKAQIEEKGMKYTGRDKSGRRMEILELENHPYFMASQFHPEFKSRPDKPSPLHFGLVKAALEHKKIN